MKNVYFTLYDIINTNSGSTNLTFLINFDHSKEDYVGVFLFYLTLPSSFNLKYELLFVTICIIRCHIYFILFRFVCRELSDETIFFQLKQR